MWGPARVELLNLPQDLYVKKIALDGRETGPIVPALAGAGVSIDIVLSDSPATITGTVNASSPTRFLVPQACFGG